MPEQPAARPVGFGQLATLAAILFTTLLPLPARIGDLPGDVKRIHLLDFFAGELILVLASIGLWVTLAQVAFMRQPERGTPHFVPALAAACTGVGIGCAIAALSFFVAFLIELPEAWETSPGAGSVGVLALGVFYAAVSVHRLWWVLKRPPEPAPEPASPPPPN